MSTTVQRNFLKVAASRDVPDSVKAQINKLARDPHSPTGNKKKTPVPDQRTIGHIANKTIGNINDARNLFQVLPDMDYARRILISAIISPGDLTDSKVLYTCTNDVLDANLTGPMLREVQKFFDETYRIRKLLPKILNDVLFEKGAYPVLTLPESSIDQIINSDQYRAASMESAVQQLDNHLKEEVVGEGVYRPYGLLGFPGQSKGQGVSFESLGADPGKISAGSHVAFPSMENLPTTSPERKGMVDALNKVNAKNKDLFLVTDNPSILKRPMVLEAKRKYAIRRVYGGKLRSSMAPSRRTSKTASTGQPGAIKLDKGGIRLSAESAQLTPMQNGKSMTTLNEVESAFYSQRRYKHIPVQPVMTKAQIGADTYGHPLVMNLPTESVIPIHMPGSPSEHVGYFVLLDINGNPLDLTSHDNYYDDIRRSLNGQDAFSSQVLQTARRGTEGMGTLSNEIIDEMARINGETLEADLQARLRAGEISGEYSISRPEHINQLMFSRHLKGQKTIMLYVPVEMLTYVAFNYNEYGVGKSLLEDGKILGTIRAALMLSNTLATINNAVGGKTIAITLEEKDENPTETVEFLLSEYAKVNSEGFSRIIGQTHPLGLADQIQNHGVNVVVEGNTRYPQVKMDVSSRDGTSRPIDESLEKSMRDRHFQMFGLSPEVADGSNQADFATTVVQNNLMLLKRVIEYQEQLEPYLTDLIRQYTLNSGILLDILREIVDNNQEHAEDTTDINAKTGEETDLSETDDFIHEFIMSLQVELPKPEVNDTTKQLEEFNKYSEALDAVLPAYFASEMFISEDLGDLSESMDAIKANIKAEFQRRWLRKRSVLPEMDVFNTVDEDDSPAMDFMDIQATHNEGLARTVMSYVRSVLQAKKNRADDETALNDLKTEIETNANGGDAEMAGDDLDNENAGGSDGIGGDELGGDNVDDFGMGDDLTDDGTGTGDDVTDLGEAGGETTDTGETGDDTELDALTDTGSADAEVPAVEGDDSVDTAATDALATTDEDIPAGDAGTDAAPVVDDTTTADDTSTDTAPAPEESTDLDIPTPDAEEPVVDAPIDTPDTTEPVPEGTEDDVAPPDEETFDLGEDYVADDVPLEDGETPPQDDTEVVDGEPPVETPEEGEVTDIPEVPDASEVPDAEEPLSEDEAKKKAEEEEEDDDPLKDIEDNLKPPLV